MIVRIWSHTETQYFFSLFFWYESIEIRKTNAQIFFNERVAWVIILMSRIFICAVAVVFYKLRDWVLRPFLKCGRLIFFKFRADFRHIVKWSKPFFISKSMQASISPVEHFSLSLVIEFNRRVDVRGNTFQSGI